MSVDGDPLFLSIGAASLTVDVGLPILTTGD
jgi:hypothetical protein